MNEAPKFPVSIPVSVIVVTKNEAAKIAACLSALTDFQEVWVVDSASRDATATIAAKHGAKVVNFIWNGAYPKKRQWCLDTLPLGSDWVLFVDADEIVLPDLVEELRNLFLSGGSSGPSMAGYFITGRYRYQGAVLKFGYPNRKIALLHRHRMEFPVVDDLDIPGMGEIEGHYQPVCTCQDGPATFGIGSLHSVMIHDALDDVRAWIFRHEKYARWEAGMNRKRAWPVDPVPLRQRIKHLVRYSPLRALRPALFFIGAYVIKGGFRDGRGGWDLAARKYAYYQWIKTIESALP